VIPHDPLSSFNADVAARYDDQLRGDEDAAASLLAELAGSGPALELAIGTGRIALPLGARGIRVDGIELSQPMVDQLRQKPGGADLDVRIGDMSTVSMDRTYPLVYLVFNTIFNVQTQDGQIECFRNAARHLDEDGVFLIEAAVPDAWLPSDRYAVPEKVTGDGVTLDVCMYDPITQILHENHVTITESGIHMAPIACRLAWPSELDLMARIAGLELAERWGGWEKQPYTGRGMHVSVYRKAG
jgi:SAM-dependent methyltransferase